MAYIHVDADQRDKLDPKSKGMFLLDIGQKNLVTSVGMMKTKKS